MLVTELFDGLNVSEPDKEVLIEINGVQHAIDDVEENSQAVVLIVDTDQEDRDMR
jgi:hypothetical protein